MDYDVVIVGSGFGGAVSACRLAAAGRKVLVLERGRRWQPKDYPREAGDAWIWDQNAPERHNGWIDMRFMDQMWVAQGAGVGGGSLIYANISVDAKPSAFASGWPSEINLETLQPYYKRVEQMLGSRTIPDNQETERLKLMREAAAAVGAPERFRKVPLAVTFDEEWVPKPGQTYPEDSKSHVNRFNKIQGTCIHCGMCDIGCSVQAKNTLDLNYLASAEASGAKIEPQSLVTHVGPSEGGWRVYYDRLIDGRRVAATVDGRLVILAAGSLGSTEILLRSRDEFGTLPSVSPAIGHGWSSNGDFLTPAFYEDRDIAPNVGPTITCAIDYLDGAKNGARFFVEDGGFANVLGSYTRAKRKRVRRFGSRARFLRFLTKFTLNDPLSNMMPWFGQAIDASNGRLHLGRLWYAPWRRHLKLDWDPARSEDALNGLIGMHVELSEKTGGKAIVPLTWTVLRHLVTPHPLGGCSMATAPSAGVVDHAGRVFGYSGLYVADGSIVPRALGLNPSKTIAALAERITDMILQRSS